MGGTSSREGRIRVLGGREEVEAGEEVKAWDELEALEELEALGRNSAAAELRGRRSFGGVGGSAGEVVMVGGSTVLSLSSCPSVSCRGVIAGLVGPRGVILGFLKQARNGVDIWLAWERLHSLTGQYKFAVIGAEPDCNSQGQSGMSGGGALIRFFCK